MYYTVNNVKLFVKDEGQGTPVLLFLHFWGGSSETWNGVTSILKDNFRCISYDHRGWGLSEKPASGYSIKALAEDTLALTEVLKLDDYIIVGHSMGGKIAQYIAAQKPAGLRKLILVAPSPAVPTIMPGEMYEGMKNAYTSLDGINATIDHVFKAADLLPEVRTRLISTIQHHNESSRLGWPAIGLLEDVSAGVENIDIPTLIIAGENDVIDSPERLELEVRSKIPDAEMVVINGAGHLIMLQEPERVAAYIDAFCKDQD